MTIPAPIILLPSNGLDYATNTQVQTLSGTTTGNTNSIKVNNSLAGVSYTPGNLEWAWTGTLAIGENVIQVVAVEKGNSSTTSSSTLILSIGSQSLIVEKNLAWPVGLSVAIAYDTTHKMDGTIISYNGTTGVLVVNVTTITGTGTFSRWDVSLSSSGIESVPATITVTYIQESSYVTINSPTGVSLRKYQDKIEVITSENTDPNVQGYNFYVSYQSGGVNNEYVKMNSKLVPNSRSNAAFTEEDVTPVGSVVETVGNLRTTTTTEEVITNYYYSFFFDKTVYAYLVQKGLLPDVGFNQDVSFYFVITAVIYDPLLSQVNESGYSPELEGSPVTITSGIQDLPSRTQNDIILTYSKELLSSNPGISTLPGTVIRDQMDPVSEEQARVYIIQDLLSRALSVSALQDFDDTNGDGISDPPDGSNKKKALQIALNFSSGDQVQRLIDDQFDKLASNVNVIRGTAQSATGTAIFYVVNPPIRDMSVPVGSRLTSLGNIDQGIPSQSYSCQETKTLSYNNREAFYNKQTGRYEIEVSIAAIVAGTAGNTPSYSINTISSGADPLFQVENPNPTEFGTDVESNHDLAGRIQLAFFADTGTEGGYAKTTVSVPGVHGVRVEKAGDPLMYRDYDSLRMEHIGGKVDIYIQGQKTAQVEDQIAFGYRTGSGDLSGELFLVTDANNFQFQTENTRVTAHTPIFEVRRVYNATRLTSYDLTNYIILGDGNTVSLDPELSVNKLAGLAPSDIIEVDYRYRSSDTYILTHQPVTSISSVVGQLSGPLTTDNWELVKLQDPLEEGFSTIAKDGLRIKFANNLPLTEYQNILNESHVMVQGVKEDLSFIGIDAPSVLVTNESNSVTYVRDVDYTLDPGTITTPASILMVDTGSIVSGQTVLVSYIAIENFTITYTINALLADVQKKVDKMKHACADVIVKEAVQNSVDFIMTIVPKNGVTSLDQLTSKIQTSVANYIGQMGVGVSLTQSDVLRAVQAVSDVDYVVLPFVRMVKADGSFIVRDEIGSPTYQEFDTGVVTSYVTSIPVLTYLTVANGGPENLFRGVFEDELPLTLQSDPVDVSNGAGRAYIMADGRLVVSTRDGNLPDNKRYQASYYVYGETGSKDLQTASLEYLRIGNFHISYDQPRTLSKQTI